METFFSVQYLYIDIRMKSVVLDVFFLIKKNKTIFHLGGKWDSDLWPNNIYVSSLLAALVMLRLTPTL